MDRYYDGGLIPAMHAPDAKRGWVCVTCRQHFQHADDCEVGELERRLNLTHCTGCMGPGVGAHQGGTVEHE